MAIPYATKYELKQVKNELKLPDEVVGYKKIITKLSLPLKPTENIMIEGNKIPITRIKSIKIDKSKSIEETVKILSEMIDNNPLEYYYGIYNLKKLQENKDDWFTSIIIFRNSLNKKITVIKATGSTVDLTGASIVPLFLEEGGDIGDGTILSSGWQPDCPDEIIIGEDDVVVPQTLIDGGITEEILNKLSNIFYVEEKETKLYNFTDGKLDKNKPVDIKATKNDLGMIKIGNNLSITEDGTLNAEVGDLNIFTKVAATSGNKSTITLTESEFLKLTTSPKECAIDLSIPDYSVSCRLSFTSNINSFVGDMYIYSTTTFFLDYPYIISIAILNENYPEKYTPQVILKPLISPSDFDRERSMERTDLLIHQMDTTRDLDSYAELPSPNENGTYVLKYVSGIDEMSGSQYNHLEWVKEQ